MTRLGLVVLALLAPLATGCRAAPGEPKEFLNERLFGPTRIHGATGNGRVSLGVSEAGEVTVLRWPGPSQFDQLAYRTMPGDDPRSRPRYGAAENQGVLLGLAFGQGDQRRTWWLRDPPWTHALRFQDDESAVLVDTARHPDAGLTVTTRYAAPPGHDVLLLDVEVTRDPASPHGDLALVVFENFAPTRVRIPYLPLYDSWVEDLDLVEYDPGAGALVHRRGRRRLWPFGKAGRQVTPEDFATLVEEDLAATEAPGTGPGLSLGWIRPDPEGPVLMLGADRAPDGFQCGPVSRRIPRRRDAFRDAADAALRGDAAHKGRSTGALLFELPTEPGATRHLGAYVSLGATVEAAGQQLDRARATGGPALLAATDEYWHQRLGAAWIPAACDAREGAVLRRTLISILQAQDPATGMIVASVSTQPPYAQDWPRDGAFLDLVLDRAGFLDEVTAHKRFYARVQRTRDRFLGVPGLAQPRGTFEMSYYADGTPGGPFVFEIDNTALTVWGWVEHARYLRAGRGEPAAAAYLEELWPHIRAATEALVAWRDPTTGLHRPASEDDVAAQTQLIQGAGAVHLALRAGLEAAAQVGAPDALVRRWSQRRDELGAAILEHLHTPGQGFSRQQGPGAVAWMVWPVAFRAPDDPLLRAEAGYLWETLERRLSGAEGGGAYEQKQLMSLLRLFPDRQDPVWGPRLAWAYRTFVDAIPEPGTLHFGETYHTTRRGQDVAYQNRTSVPHVWAAGLVYLSAVLFHEGQVAPPAP